MGDVIDMAQAREEFARDTALRAQRERAAEILTTMAETEADPMMRQALQQAAIQVSDFPNKAKFEADRQRLRELRNPNKDGEAKP